MRRILGTSKYVGNVKFPVDEYADCCIREVTPFTRKIPTSVSEKRETCYVYKSEDYGSCLYGVTHQKTTVFKSKAFDCAVTSSHIP